MNTILILHTELNRQSSSQTTEGLLSSGTFSFIIWSLQLHHLVPPSIRSLSSSGPFHNLVPSASSSGPSLKSGPFHHQVPFIIWSLQIHHLVPLLIRSLSLSGPFQNLVPLVSSSGPFHNLVPLVSSSGPFLNQVPFIWSL